MQNQSSAFDNLEPIINQIQINEQDAFTLYRKIFENSAKDLELPNPF